jgi:hypothetical protein
VPGSSAQEGPPAGAEAPIDPRAHARLALGLYPVLLAIASLPLFLCTYPPLTDYPNHLARMHVLRAYAQSAPLREMVEVAWLPLPNLAMDLVVPFVPGLSVPASGRLFVLLTFAVISSGCLFLQHALLGTVTLGALFGCVLLYNGILAWGFLNYLMGVGLVLWSLGLYVRWRGAPPARRLAVTSAASLALYLGHLYAFALYGVGVVVIELERFARGPDRSLRRLAADLGWAGLQALLPALLFLRFNPQQGEGPVIAWGSLQRKLDALTYLTGGHHPVLDLCTTVGLVGVLAFLFGRRAAALVRPVPQILAVLAALFAAMPVVLLSVSSADRRIVVAIGLLFAAGLSLAGVTRRAAAAVVAALLALTSVQSGLAARRFAQWEARLRPYREALAGLPPGSKLAFAYAPSLPFWPVSRRHLPSLVTIERDGFAPNFFAHRHQQPTALTPAYAALARAPQGDALLAELERVAARRDAAAWRPLFGERLAGYDHLLVMVEDRREYPDLAGAPVALAYEGEDFRLYRLDPRGVEPGGR